MIPALTITLSLSLALVLFVRLFQCIALLGSPPPEPAGPLPPVRILKPLKGLDPGLGENLESIFRQEYKFLTVMFGARDEDDPGLDVARRISAAYPSSVVLADSAEVGQNPKVNNLDNLLRASGLSGDDLLLISDSNVRVDPGYLRDLVARYLEAGSRGMVWSLFRATGEEGLGGALEALQVNTFVMGGMAAMVRFTPGALGKSMLISRRDLESVGGFGALSRYIAEDQVLAEELAKHGLPVVMSSHLIDNVIGRRSTVEFIRRHLRWATLRRQMKFGGYFVEILLNPVFLSAVGASVLHTPAAALAFAAVLLFVSTLDFLVERLAGVRRNPLVYPFLEILLSLLKGVLWFVPFFSRKLVWRGNVIRIGPRTMIEMDTHERDIR